jgi:hypothetical protein
MTAPRRSSIYGPKPCLVAGDVVWSQWDPWYCLVACLDQDRDLAALADAPQASTRASWSPVRRSPGGAH